jgi:peptidoglycan/LPS O-acetylase OafA/YrhL
VGSSGGGQVAPRPMPVPADTVPGVVAVRRAPTTGHLDQVDLLRLLTFSAVIAVHAIDFTQPDTSRAAAGTLMLLQFGRAVFFSLTGFVLVHSTRGRPVVAPSFWRRRFPYVLVPYLVWTVVYYLFGELTSSSPSLSWGALGGHLLGGDAQYHLYFLLVTMQLYLVFPLLVRFVRATTSGAWSVLAVVGVLDVAWLALLQYEPAPGGWAGQLWARSYELLPTYAVYVLIGCYAAVHLDAVTDFVARHRRRLLVAGLAAAAAAEAVYVVQLRHDPPRVAAGVLQPAMLLDSLGALLVLVVVCDRWAAGRRSGRRTVERASDVSFGVYLVHPLVLSLLLMSGLRLDGQRVPAAAATVLAIAGTAVGASVFSLLARRTPLSLALTGRPRRRVAVVSSASAQATSSAIANSVTTMAP